MCQRYWEIYNMGIPVLTGPSPLAKLLGCSTPCDCDVVVYVNDIDKIEERQCVWAITDPTFIHRPIWIGGYPHVSLHDLEKIVSPEISETIKCIMEKTKSAPRVL
ncbi:hypothetical protein PAE3304 [Pyrobaculum aerophilum str. IM2]|uniref:Uncharacterized protein n=2 Tax=Pyrobaculum aerophilum TaxID=13773 RepID=Q8ZTD6_PYRAE|nr:MULTISPECIES: hypothetical protein [Pyrobaculum]AAL64826.1 hypothetical protein PAE3304 [Pyrobaculum aerophilum str. IM2]HII47563.1 hypothetical protein [Pyrobaculum aerophilum]